MVNSSQNGDYGIVPWLAWIEEKLAMLETFITLITFNVMLALMVVQVIFRYWLEIALPWSEELIRYLFVVSSFLGAALVSKDRSHITITIIDSILEMIKDDKRRERINYWIWLAADIATLGVLSVFASLTYRFYREMQTTDQLSPAMGFPVAVVVGAMLLGTCLMIVHYLIKIINNTFGLKWESEV
jgi:TRAP-type C4-dicarboxylate transport system permease small subunit